MSEPAEMVAEETRFQSAQALLLVRVSVTVVILVCSLFGVLVCSAAAKYGAMYAELGIDAELPAMSRLATQHARILLAGFVLLAAATVFFLWSRGKAAAWMAGLGLLLLALFAPMMFYAMATPLLRVVTEMGSM